MSNGCDRGGGWAGDGANDKLHANDAAIGGDVEEVKKTPMGM